MAAKDLMAALGGDESSEDLLGGDESLDAPDAEKPDEKTIAAEDLLAAIEGGDAASVAAAFKTMVDLCKGASGAEYDDEG